MALTEAAISAYLSPILLGCYEHELHPVFEKVVAGKYARVLNIGCSVGYYAVGLAYRMPKTSIEAFDIDPQAQKHCRDMANNNNVADRVSVSGLFCGDDFAKYKAEKTLVLMDIEGGEKDLLDPEKYPALQKMDIIVEMHDLLDATISTVLRTRFAPTHTVEIFKNRASLPEIEKLLPENYYLDPYDHFVLGWERRDGRTPWGVFRAK